MPRTPMTEEARYQKELEKLETLPEDWRLEVERMDPAQIKTTLAEVTLNERENQNNKKLDQDLAEKKEAYATAAAGYKEATKANKLRITFLLKTLESKHAI